MPPVSQPQRKRAPHFLREWRKFREKSQSQVADYLGVDQSTVSKFERGLTPYDQDLLEKLSFLYDCEPAELISLDPMMPDMPQLLLSMARTASRDTQERIVKVVDALLKAG